MMYALLPGCRYFFLPHRLVCHTDLAKYWPRDGLAVKGPKDQCCDGDLHRAQLHLTKRNNRCRLLNQNSGNLDGGMHIGKIKC